MASLYPGGLDAFVTTHQDDVDEIIHASTINDLADAVNKIEAALGINPSLGSADVLHAVAASGAAQTVNFSTADVWDITLTAPCTLSLAGFTAGQPDFLTLILRQDGTGSRLVTWPTITWIGSGIPPILQTATGAVDSVVLFSFDGGTTVYGIAQTSASGLRAGTSFPGSPSDGDLFYRTDRRILYEYDTASTHWLSLDRKYVPINTAYAAISATGGLGRIPLFEDVYIESWATNTSVATTNNGSNFWSIILAEQNVAEVSTTISTITTALDTVATWVVHNVPIGSVIDHTVFPVLLVFLSAKTGAPGTIQSDSMLVLRSVG